MKLSSIILFLVFMVGCARDSSDIVETSYGSIQGYEEDGVSYFLGIPFAEPPIGDLRWKAPQALEKWDGILETTSFGAACMQPTNIGNSLFLELMLDGFGLAWYEKAIINFLALLNFSNGTEYSEDCLFLNVIAPKDAKNLPVMFWIHGGASRFGSGGEDIYKTTKFAEERCNFSHHELSTRLIGLVCSS